MLLSTSFKQKGVEKINEWHYNGIMNNEQVSNGDVSITLLKPGVGMSQANKDFTDELAASLPRKRAERAEIDAENEILKIRLSESKQNRQQMESGDNQEDGHISYSWSRRAVQRRMSSEAKR